jgi:hypothetical protein
MKTKLSLNSQPPYRPRGTRIAFYLLSLVSICSHFYLSYSYAQETSTATATSGEIKELSPIQLADRAAMILKSQCLSCHGPDKAEGELRIDSRAALLQGGSLGTTIDANTPEHSLLLQVIEGKIAGLEMPPKNPLPNSEIQLLRNWIKGGAVWSHETWNPTEPSTEEDPSNSAQGDAWSDPRNPVRKRWNGERLHLWSLGKLVAPSVPFPLNNSSLANTQEDSDPTTSTSKSQPLSTPESPSTTPLNAIDLFVKQYRIEKHLPEPEPADARLLIRRLYFDLCGLPPTKNDMAQWLDTISESKYEQLVDRLISSPRYGEHIGRMWLDVVRYSDSNGFDWDEYRPKAWKYRDYVIESFNQDQPFDRFIMEQLAGDELLEGEPRSEDDLRLLIATGFLRLGPQDNAAALFNEQDRSRAEFLSDITETTGSAFLGMTLSCCRCHDHKTDPLLQSDYFRIRAFFAGVQYGDARPLETLEYKQEIDRWNEELDRKISAFQQQLKELEPKADTGSNQKDANDASKAKAEMISSEIKSLEGLKKQHEFGLIISEKRDSLPATFVFYQGDHRSPREEVSPGIPAVLDPKEMSVPEHQKPSSGRRTALAQWIASPQNPWTARVIVNRLWQLHFGEGLVSTPNDFGLSGQRPRHPQLLDWLAAEFIRSNWSIKHVQRLIVTSRTYREKLTAQSWPRTIRRLSAEQLRDAMLSTSGLLQHRAGGPPIWPPVPAEVLTANPATLDDNETKTKGWYPSPENKQTVRSIYLIQKRTVRIPFMDTFDLPDNTVSCGCRGVSIVAPQALTMLNGDWSLQAAYALAEKVQSTYSSPEEVVGGLYGEVFHRSPTPSEQKSCLDFLSRRSLVELSRVLLNTNEFGFIE